MKRRTFLVGVGGTALGGSTLLGTGAFTRVESQRRVKIEVAEDPDAYLGLDGCADSPNRSYTKIDDSGHLAVEMSPKNPTEGGGEGINSDSRTWFDRVFQLCNQGKEKACIWIGDDEDWPRVPESFDDAGDRRVDFYVENEPYRSIVGEANAVGIEVGDCICVGIRTNTKDLSKEAQLLEELGNEVVIHANTGAECAAQLTPEEEFVAFQVDLAWGEPLGALDSDAGLTYSDQQRLLVWQHGVADNEAQGAQSLATENGNRFDSSNSTLDFDQFFEEVTHVRFLDEDGNTVFEWDGTPNEPGAITSLDSETPVEAEIEFEMAAEIAEKAEDLYDELDARDDLTENETRAKAALREGDDFGVQVTWTAYGGGEFGWNPPEFQLLRSETTMFKDNGTKTLTVDLPPLQSL